MTATVGKNKSTETVEFELGVKDRHSDLHNLTLC
jgi:hypothetical protein